MSKYFYEWHWESISNLHIGQDGLEAWDTEDFDFGDSLSNYLVKALKLKRQFLMLSIMILTELRFKNG